MKSKRVAIDIDPEEFLWILQNAPRLARTQKKFMEKVYLSPFLFQDIFYALYEDYPELSPLEMLSTGARLNRMVIDLLLKMPEFRKARIYSKGNMPGSGMFTLYFAEVVFNNLGPKIMETANEIAVLEEELSFAKNQKAAAGRVARIAEEAGLREAADLYRAAVEYWETEVADKSRQLTLLSARLRASWNNSGRRKICAASKVSEEGGSLIEAGVHGTGTGKGMWHRGDFGQLLKMAGQYSNSPKLKGIAKRVIQLKEAASQNRRKHRAEKDIFKIRGINYGTDLSLVVPEELADYLLPGRKPYFLQRFAEGKLCSYEAIGEKKKDKGTLVICLDNSGSMQGAKEITGKAVAIALMEIACRQKRDVVVIMFGGTDDRVKTFEASGGRCPTSMITEIAECFLCSPGTDFEKPLKMAAGFFENRRYPGGEIIFITDGACDVSRDFNSSFIKLKKERGIRTISLIVGYGNISAGSLTGFSDELIHSRELTAVDVASDLFDMLQGE